MSKGLEALKSLFDTMPFAFLESNTMKDLKIIEKELKALKIIKEKELNIFFIKRYNRKEFNYQCRYEQQLTKEEYNLLKEILNNDD